MHIVCVRGIACMQKHTVQFIYQIKYASVYSICLKVYSVIFLQPSRENIFFHIKKKSYLK